MPILVMSTVSFKLIVLNNLVHDVKQYFKRIYQREAIEWFKANHVTKDDGTFYEFGENISEKPERKITDAIMLCRFLLKLKFSKLGRCPKNEEFIYGVDVLCQALQNLCVGLGRFCADF